MSEIKRLSDYAHVRKRTEMYFGSRNPHTQTVILYNEDGPYLEEITWVPALFTAFREVFDNALDEVIGHGHGNRVDITYDEANMIFSVQDNGRGIPIDWNETEGMHTATLALSHARAGRNFGERGEVAGTNGIGASGVNFSSEFFSMEIVRDGKKFTQDFHEGTSDNDELQVKPPKIKDLKSDKTGTKISFKPSKEVFSHMILPEKFIRSRVLEVAIANPYVKFTYNGEVIKVKPNPEKTLFADKKPIVIEIKEETFRSKFILVPGFTQNGDHVHTIVNNIPALNGGSHIEQFRRQFYGNLLTALERESKKRKLTPNRSDVNEGMLIYNITNMRAPNFDSQSKTRLINEEAATFVRKNLDDEELFKGIIRKNTEWIDEIFQRCADRTHKKEADDLAKASKKMLKKKIPKLMEASSSKRSDCILFLAEGDSAIAGMGAVRDPKIHAGLPLRGKVMNVNGESPKKVMDSMALQDIMTAIGLQIGVKADRKNLRYGKIYVAHDMDHDGLNIGALLMNFLYTYWPELFQDKDDPFVNIFMTPFIIAEKGKERKYWYSHNYGEFDPEKNKGWAITRAKGLGTLTKEDWQHSLRNPELYSVVDDGKMKESLDLIFNNGRSDDRKKWIGL